MINEAKTEVANSIFFHANDVNTEIFNYAQEIYEEKEEKRKQKLKEEEKEEIKKKGKEWKK